MNKNIVKIILIATDAKKKSLVFVDENLKVYSLKEAILATQNGLLRNIYTVNRSGNIYLRSTRGTPSIDKLDKISISSYQLFYSLSDLNKILSIPAFKNYWQKYQQNIFQEEIENYIIIEGHLRVAKTTAKKKLTKNKDIIFSASEKFDVDPYLLSGILIDEIARLAPFEEITDLLAGSFIGKNTSGGIAQVKTETARNLILSDYYNPDPNKFSSKEKIIMATCQQIFSYLKEPKHSIFFAGARMRYFTDEWKKFIDLSQKPEIIATLYSLDKDNPKSNPQPNIRGLQIANEFYNLAKEWLK
jgi:hypothetical protein